MAKLPFAKPTKRKKATSKLAMIYGVSKTSIRNVLIRKTWNHI